ncbi:MAG: DNA primase [Candidatus Pacebacteria bacterium CG_4_10_14_3_um_filter_34_15]|nr:DNA primase [Candidatus Paceibacterota bacterium]OIO44308.1 MAG: DNA primase [Candidatus Pacebacteria bacterium CG1_02_43_31]PIX82029.1 MAG: DNA primase [Candidatus Pacebacteria bacterium CG_4_10_14_3_um_filter_34_15]PJC44012.1 MAG: DNA primase [Candidatus Pacebacteria bacterium CG_4_9_14_0_2_um_filter_34_50]
MSQIQEIKEASDIVEIIGSRISLQRAGSYMRGLCPFHGEKSPSFFVDESLQRFKCFGCGESGDVLTFLEKYDGMTFAEALEELANRAGITLQKFTKTTDDFHREKILEVLSLAKQYYHYLLTDHKVGAVAREYLKNRSVTNESIKIFQMGYALTSWDGLINFLHKKKKYDLNLLLDAGLIIKGKTGRYYDRFRSRIIFPLNDHRGRTVGFSGRVIDGDEKDAKYINSPETILYHKSKMLFGFSELYQEIRKAKEVVVVEGEFDVISSTQAHMNSIVAIKGSALTADHAKLLKRTVDKVLLSLDTDDAGVQATKKAITALKETNLELRAVIIPNGKDPDELIKSDPKKWRDAVKASIPAHEFLIKASLMQHDKTKPEGKRAIMKELSPLFAQIEHAVELEHYVKLLAGELGVKPESVKEDVDNYKNKESFGNSANKKSEKEKENLDDKPPTVDHREKLEKYILFLLFHSDKTKILGKVENLTDVSFQLSGANFVLKELAKYSGIFDLKSFAAKLPEDIQEKLFDIYSDQILLKDLDSLDMDKEWLTLVKKLKTLIIKDEVSRITQELSELDEKLEKTEEEVERQNVLLKRIVKLRN